MDGLYGGSDRGLYASQYGDEDKVGRLFRLQSGKAWSVTTFRYDVRHQEPGLYVSRSGRILNWAEGHLAVFAHGEWRSAELTEPLHDTHVLDAGDDLYFLTTEALHHIDVENRFSTRRLSWPHDSDGRWRVALWGTHEALVLRYWDPGLYRLDLTSGEIEEATALNEKLGSRKLYDLTAAPDGSVWVLVNDLVRRSYLFVTISTNGEIDIREETSGIRHDNTGIYMYPESVLFSDDGSAWLGLRDHGLLRLKGGEADHFYADEVFELSDIRHFAADDRGNLYAASPDGVYRFSRDRPRPRAMPLSAPGRLVWSYELDRPEHLLQAWRVGDSVAVRTRFDDRIVVLDAGTGRVRWEMPVPDSWHEDPWLIPGEDPGTIVFSNGRQLRVVSEADGELLGELEAAADHRIAPVPYRGDFIIVERYRGSALVRIGRHGEQRWRLRLPGYAMAHPAHAGKLIAIQTRGGSYGGQATTVVDIEAGEILWSDTVNAYGDGTAFAQGGSVLVETDTWLSVEATEGWLIGRDAQSGEKIWHLRQPGFIAQAPLVDSKRGHAFVLFENGDVVAVDVRNGAELWRQTLPEGSYSHSANSYTAYWPSLTLDNGRLLVLDRNRVLHRLEPSTGRILSSLALKKIEAMSERLDTADIMTMPWKHETLLIVVAGHGVFAYDDAVPGHSR